jgi:hypothetical protein
MSDEETSTRPSFSAPLWAAARQGSKEIAQVLPAFPESVRTVEEPGTMGNPTPQQVTEQMQQPSSFDQMLDAYGSRAQERNDQERDMDR